jgi:DNA-binding transcriptional MerR regulator
MTTISGAKDTMRIAELSRQSGVSVPTIKYYVREGLLAHGERTSPNQARYGERHLRRLKLVRALVEIGGLSISHTRDVLASIESPEKTLHETLGKAHHAVTPRFEREADEASLALASRQVEELIERREWQVNSEHPAWGLLVQVLAALRELGQDDIAALLDDYAEAVERLAELEAGAVIGRPDTESVLEGVVIGTVLGDSLLAALRRLADANVSARLSPKAARRLKAGRS